MPVDPRNLIRVQSTPALVRNVCILAHVDHGKTSLSDCLLATNGIISQSEQGKLLYLDSREDEQERGITMEASAISLFFKAAQRPLPGQPPKIDEFLVNLIDSPGHIDFSSEVSTTSRLCDGCVVVVDAVEGVCSQTVTALKQSWDEQLTPILMINKMDKLFAVLEMSALDAYLHLVKLVEQVNAVIGTFFAGKRAEEEYQASLGAARVTTDEMSDEDLYFDPIKGNVVFGSAIDGWGFSLGQFAAIYERKLGLDRDKLLKCLWGDYYFDPKTKKVSKGVREKKLKPMFVQFILENVWAVYRAANEYDTEKLEKIISSLQLKAQIGSEPKATVNNIFHAWIPVSRALLMAIVKEVPSPLQAQQKRMPRVLENTPKSELISAPIRDGMMSCSSTGPAVAFVSKVIQVPASEIPNEVGLAGSIDDLRLKSSRGRSTSEKEVVIGVSRVFSGVVSVGDSLELLAPSYLPGDAEEESGESQATVTIKGLYMLMGRDLVPIKKAFPGTIVGIAGLDGKIIKSGTLVDSANLPGPNLAAGSHIAPPILHVALEPVDPRQLDELEEGLKLLNISDPSVEFQISDDGEYILGTAGELHLERCLKDLQSRFAKIEVEASEPVVPFQESIAPGGEWDSEDQRGLVELEVCDISIKLLVEPWAPAQQEAEAEEVPNLVAKRGSAVLFDASRLLKCRHGVDAARGPLDDAIISGFTAAAQKGPLIAEAVQNFKVTLLSIEGHTETPSAPTKRRIMAATRKLVHQGLEQWSPRVLLAMYRCEIQAPTEVLGKLYSVVTRRHGRIISEELKDGTPFFNVSALVPVVQSFGFSEEIRNKTSGSANPQLVFDGFEVLDQDPYWVPTTLEEYEELGDTADRENIALGYVHGLRKRKGLFINEKVVENAEKNKSFRK